MYRAMNIDLFHAEHNYRRDKAINEYRRASNPAIRLRARKRVATIAKLVGVNTSLGSAQPVVADQAPFATTGVQVWTR